jgi:hypothetical protein
VRSLSSGQASLGCFGEILSPKKKGKKEGRKEGKKKQFVTPSC